ncbi:hypothetical protein AB0N05_38750 [Nocardia sp. NPDC051030]|uniref:hypothetical protein n=1 Tax=Nocardia sp. NPDC051030 TaxID=3155162 RepID=UPI00342AD679
MNRSFDGLLDEAATVSWTAGFLLAGRAATEQRPSWGHQRQQTERLAVARAALDIHTGGGESVSG